MSDPGPSSSLAPGPFTQRESTIAAFRYADADIILRSSDKVDFYVHRLILSVSSPVFHDMFSIPQPPPDVDSPRLPIIDMAEDQHALKIVLGFFYAAACLPPLEDFDDVKIALNMVRKYDLPGPVPFLKHRLQALAIHTPERVFAVAWLYQWKDMALVAARHTKMGQSIFGPSYFPEFQDVPAEAFWKLEEYHQRRRAAVGVVALLWNHWLGPDQLDFPIAGEAGRCDCVRNGRGVVYYARPSNLPTSAVAGWWTDHMKRLYSALREDPRPDIVTSTRLLMPTINEAQACDVCEQDAIVAMDAFNEIFKAEMERRISEVGAMCFPPARACSLIASSPFVSSSTLIPPSEIFPEEKIAGSRRSSGDDQKPEARSAPAH
ncbi:hypothetical protein EVG20_g4865 [Dentipellis fragilis]|uniref:BTB domain-containing protein n=1 Tax=Dentipellis fragilis TaxID=205917 RepID=A0A4Y9YYM4_9AGAM|nr:hypothetical protein EVG20_g4865 [Dentipellis fragilis]